MSTAPHPLFAVFSRRSVLVALFLATLVGAQEARADEAPIIAVMETGGTHVDAERFRQTLARELGVPVISMLEAGPSPARGILAIAIMNHGRRAAIRYVPVEGTRYAMMIRTATRAPADLGATWLIQPCASAIRTSDTRRAATNPSPDVIDPWLSQHLVPPGDPARPGDDPWQGVPRHSVPNVWVTDIFVADDTVNPWTESVQAYRTEQAERTAPRRGRGAPTDRPRRRPAAP